MIHLHMLAASMSGEEIARQVINTLALEYSIQCFSHTLNHVGDRFNAPHVLDFTTY